MTKKVILWILVCFLLISSVNAITDDQLTNKSVLMWYGNNLTDSSNVANDLIIAAGSPTLQTICYIGSCYNFDGNDAFFENFTNREITNDWMICAWVNTSAAITDYGTLWGYNDGGQMLARINFEQAGTNNMRLQAGATNTGAASVVLEGLTGWNHVCYGQNTTHIFHYFNGTLNGSVSYATDTNSNQYYYGIGAATESGGLLQYFTGGIDEFYRFNTSFYDTLETDEVVSYLYQKNTSLGETTAVSSSVTLISPADDITINVNNINFEYNYTGIAGAECYFYTNETGALSLTKTNSSPVENTTLNFNHELPEGVYSWLVGCNNTNATTRTLSIKTTNITIKATEIVSNINISTFNVTFDDGQQYNVTSGSVSFFTTAGSHSFNITAAGYYDEIDEQLITAVNGTIYTVNGFYYNKLNISGSYINNATAIEDFTAQVVSLNYSWSMNFTSIGEFINATLTNGTYQVSILNYAQDTNVQNVTINSEFQSLFFSIYNINSFNFSFLNEETETVITGVKIYVELIGDAASYNFSTTSGKLYVDLITPSQYTIRYWANQSYGSVRNYIYNLTNASYTDLSLYLLSGTATGHSDLTVTLYDQTSLTTIENAVIYLQRYYIDDNAYKTVAMYETDISGKAYYEVQQSEELYKFVVDYPYGTTELTTEPLYIQAASLNLYVNLLGDVGEEFYDANSIQAQITHNNLTREFTVTYTDSEIVASEYCLYVKENGLYSKTVHNSSCITSNSGTITLSHPNVAGNYYAVFTATIDGEETTILTGWKGFLSEDLKAGSFGIFMAAVLVIIFAMISQFSLLAPLLAGAGLMFGKMLGLIPISWGYVIMIFIAAIILIIIIEMLKK